MPGVTDKDLKRYFEEAKRWDQDRLRAALRSRNLAWIVAAVASAAAIAGIAAVAVLSPLKTSVPFVVRVDNATGAVDVMTGLQGQRSETYTEAISKYFLGQYVRARESWLASAAEENFRQVAIMSTGAEQTQWADIYRGTNPKSPQVVYGASGSVVIAIRTISFINPKVANIRFHRIEVRNGQAAQSDWIATVTFAYTKAPMLESDRLRNPLGFQVSDYRADPEIVR